MVNECFDGRRVSMLGECSMPRISKGLEAKSSMTGSNNRKKSTIWYSINYIVVRYMAEGREWQIKKVLFKC